MKRILFTLALLLAPAIAEAQSGLLKPYGDDVARIATTALSASSTSFTFDKQNAVRTGIWDKVLVWVTVVDAANNVSAITMACTGSRDGGTTDYGFEDCSVSSGVCTSSAASWVRNPGTGTTLWIWRIDSTGVPEVECTFTDTGGGATESIAVTVTAAGG
jgi:hypothetical protein